MGALNENSDSSLETLAGKEGGIVEMEGQGDPPNSWVQSHLKSALPLHFACTCSTIPHFLPNQVEYGLIKI